MEASFSNHEPVYIHEDTMMAQQEMRVHWGFERMGRIVSSVTSAATVFLSLMSKKVDN